MKTILIASAFTLVGSCATTKYTTKIQNLKDSIQIVDSALVATYANTITSEDLSNEVYTISSDNFEGRKTGELGQKLASQFLENYYIDQQIQSPIDSTTYFQTIPKSFLPKDTKVSENVLAYIKGSEKPDEVIIITAHYDHLGILTDGQINSGADDNGSGTAAIMEIAQAFKMAKDAGHGPKRSVLFIHFTAEEIGLGGSEYYTDHPVFPLENTIVDLNIDMIGRVDAAHQNNKNYMYLIGSDRLSNELHYISEKVNKTYFNIDLDYKYNAEDDNNHFYTRSDHFNFAKNGIPVIFYFNGVHEDYHKPSDKPDKIDFEELTKRTKLIFATAWQLANQDHRLKIDNGIIQ
ncbi:M28 family metallopeptidase [Yeosuana sp.]|uniref:M28 family metallopeptidase n=1 Tax=Yeosuana sp. TaxID=2529388 RepID=UPI004054CF22|tara:strand:+ start:412 stop:1458 length:1047 start_codon:yes stop_codon:yes gene_type:complete